MQIDNAQPDDLPALLALLERSGLPQEGLADHVATALVARDEQHIIGSAALEIYGSAALLRSVAVDAERRGVGLGQQLVKAALDLAHKHGVGEVYLLTETAAEFFPRQGFRPIARDEVNPAIHQSVEWSCVCPTSAQALTLTITPALSHSTGEGV